MPVVELPVVEHVSPVIDSPVVEHVSPVVDSPEIPNISHQYDFSSFSDIPNNPVTTQTESNDFFEELFGNKTSILNTQPITVVESIFPTVNENKKSKKQKKKSYAFD